MRHLVIAMCALVLASSGPLANAQSTTDAPEHTSHGAESDSAKQFSLPKFVSKVVAISETSMTLQGVSGWAAKFELPITQDHFLTVNRLGPWSSTFEDATAKQLQIGDLFAFLQYRLTDNNQVTISYYTVKQDVINRWRASVVETSGVDPMALPPFVPPDPASSAATGVPAQQGLPASRAADLLNGISSAANAAAAQLQSTSSPIQDSLRSGLRQTEAVRTQAGKARQTQSTSSGSDADNGGSGRGHPYCNGKYIGPLPDGTLCDCRNGSASGQWCPNHNVTRCEGLECRGH